MWQTAFRDAAGVLSAYFAPPEYGISSLPVSVIERDSSAMFLREIRRRLDLGRASEFSKRLQSVRTEISTAYRHQLFFTRDQVDGKIHVPRLLVTRARNGDAPIPIIRAAQQTQTPENLFISEAVSRSYAVARSWRAVPGPERRIATAILGALRRFESRKPWSDLRLRPRPDFGTLRAAVRSRIDAAIVADQPVGSLLDLFDTDPGAASAFEASASVLTLPIPDNPDFEDKLFELLCLSWILEPLRAHLSSVEVWPSNLKGAGGKPLLQGRLKTGEGVRVLYQTGIALPEGTWTYHPSGRRLVGIIDTLIEVGDPPNRKYVLIDAKNRRGSETEVFYKMLGYQENFQLPTYNAIALFPSPDVETRLKVLAKGQHRVWMVRLPLQSGKAIVGTVVNRLIGVLGR